MKTLIRIASPEDATAISQLVQSSFRACVAPDWELEAQESFYDETTAEKLAARLRESAFAAVYEVDAKVEGVIVLPRPNLVQLCFVATEHLRHGIGGALWEAPRAHLEENHPEVKTVELNASPYAVAAYKAMGFYPISKQYRRRGWVATRMACWLPDRGLERASHAA
jgi:GNAT superfamily N-acetyltransferase